MAGVGNVKQHIVILAIRDGSISIFEYLCMRLPSEYPAVKAVLKALDDLDRGKFFDVGKDM